MTSALALICMNLLDPLLWIGCLIAGLANRRRYWLAILIGLAWAAVLETFNAWVSITGNFGDFLAYRIIAAILITTLMFFVGRWKHAHRPTEPAE